MVDVPADKQVGPTDAMIGDGNDGKAAWLLNGKLALEVHAPSKATTV
jgi:hypothetical protein